MRQLKIEKKLYQKRFNFEHQQRNSIWKVLCNDFFQQFISKNDIVLDVATGYGEFINNIRCKEKIACDINTDSKKYLNNNVKFLLGSSVKISLKDNSVDTIFISNFFEHISKEEIVKTIKEAHRVLKPNGQVIVLQPNIRFCSKDYWMFFDHITPIDDRGLTEAFVLSQFTQIYKIERFLPYTTKSILPKHTLAVKIYLNLNFLWRIFGKQSLLIYKK